MPVELTLPEVKEEVKPDAKPETPKAEETKPVTEVKTEVKVEEKKEELKNEEANKASALEIETEEQKAEKTKLADRARDEKGRLLPKDAKKEITTETEKVPFHFSKTDIPEEYLFKPSDDENMEATTKYYADSYAKILKEKGYPAAEKFLEMRLDTDKDNAIRNYENEVQNKKVMPELGKRVEVIKNQIGLTYVPNQNLAAHPEFIAYAEKQGFNVDQLVNSLLEQSREAVGYKKDVATFERAVSSEANVVKRIASGRGISMVTKEDEKSKTLKNKFNDDVESIKKYGSAELKEELKKNDIELSNKEYVDLYNPIIRGLEKEVKEGFNVDFLKAQIKLSMMESAIKLKRIATPVAGATVEKSGSQPSLPIQRKIRKESDVEFYQ